MCGPFKKQKSIHHDSSVSGQRQIREVYKVQSWHPISHNKRFKAYANSNEKLLEGS